MKSPSDLKIGDAVVVKPGVKDDDTGGDLGGWQGRINGFGENEDGSPTVCIAWDSLTLRSMPRAVVEHSEVEGFDWRTYYLSPSEVEPATARDTEEDVEDALDELESQTDWLHLGEEGRRIQAVLNGIDRDDEIALVEAWEVGQSHFKS